MLIVFDEICDAVASRLADDNTPSKLVIIPRLHRGYDLRFKFWSSSTFAAEIVKKVFSGENLEQSLAFVSNPERGVFEKTDEMFRGVQQPVES